VLFLLLLSQLKSDRAQRASTVMSSTHSIERDLESMAIGAAGSSEVPESDELSEVSESGSGTHQLHNDAFHHSPSRGILGVDSLSLKTFSSDKSNCADVISYAMTSKDNLEWVKNNALFLYNDLQRKRYSVLPRLPQGEAMNLETFARACALSNAALFVGYQVPLTYTDMIAMIATPPASRSTLGPMAVLQRHRERQRPAIGRAIVAAANLPHPFETNSEWHDNLPLRPWNISMQIYHLRCIVDWGDRSPDLIQAVTTIVMGGGFDAVAGLIRALVSAPTRVDGTGHIDGECYPEHDPEKPWIVPGPKRLGYFEPSILTGDDEEHTEREVHDQLISSAPDYAELFAAGIESHEAATFALGNAAKLSLENFRRFRALTDNSDAALPTLTVLIAAKKGNLVVANVLDAYEKLVKLGTDYHDDDLAMLANHYALDDGGARLTALIRGDCWAPGFPPETWRMDRHYLIVKLFTLASATPTAGTGRQTRSQLSKHLDTICDMFSRGNKLLVNAFLSDVLRMDVETLEEALQLDNVTKNVVDLDRIVPAKGCEIKRLHSAIESLHDRKRLRSSVESSDTEEEK
jgi:hypothetical protein